MRSLARRWYSIKYVKRSEPKVVYLASTKASSRLEAWQIAARDLGPKFKVISVKDEES